MSIKSLNFSKYENTNSKFTAELQNRGGNITFSNSGKGGNKKYFNLSLDTFLQCLRDIRNHISEFQGHENYVEKEWRDLGSKYFKDGPANAQITVQTKPMFTTLSKIIMWANSLNLSNINPEERINLEVSKIENTINELDELAESFKPKANEESTESNIIRASKSIRLFAKMVFEYFYDNKWELLLNECEIRTTQISGREYKIYDHKNFKNLIGLFESEQNKETLSSSNTQRFFTEPILIKEGNYYHFTTQWNAKGDYNLSFNNLKDFFENRFKDYYLFESGHIFYLSKNINSLSNFDINGLKEPIKNSGLNYTDQLITRFVSSLVTKPFLLLTGLSGSGKTKLALSFAQWICEQSNQYCLVPVGADWTNREPLLGYVDALDPENYVTPENGALELIIEANKLENQHKPYFLILDEMNLSHVERYFADFLSVMESKDPFRLHSDDQTNKSGVPSKLNWPDNLFVIGTVNIDETTYMFSPKVLDRANVIEFRIEQKEITKFLEDPMEIKKLNGEGSNMATSFVELYKTRSLGSSDELIKVLSNFFSELKTVGAEFGYRTAMEIQTLFAQIEKIDPAYSEKEDEKIDIAIMQKLLPKLHGSRRKLQPTLKILAQNCLKNKQDKIFDERGNYKLDESNSIRFKLSFEKITIMYKNIIENGFTSYAEA